MPKQTFVGSVLVGALAWLSWWAWMGWDTEIVIDPATGNETGPYEAWQVVGSALCVVMLVVVATLVWGALVAAMATTVGYTGGWLITAFTEDDQGLALVGGVFVFIGLAAASTLIAALTRRFTRSRAA